MTIRVQIKLIVMNEHGMNPKLMNKYKLKRLQTRNKLETREIIYFFNRLC